MLLYGRRDDVGVGEKRRMASEREVECCAVRCGALDCCLLLHCPPRPACQPSACVRACVRACVPVSHTEKKGGRKGGITPRLQLCAFHGAVSVCLR